MSYSERDGQVILTMSREDYKLLVKSLAYAARQCAWYQDVEALLDRLAPLSRTEIQTLKNAAWILRGSCVPLTAEQQAFVQKVEQVLGKPHYTPYQVEAEKK